LEDIRNKKQLVLTTLKACIIEGGDISIQIFVKMSRLLPSNFTFPDHAHLLCSEPSIAWIEIIRRYHFTYIDSTALLAVSPLIADPALSNSSLPQPPPPSHFQNLSTTPLSTHLLIRCFSQFPLDSLMRGLFLTLEEGEKYRQICLRYSRALERPQASTSASVSSASGDVKNDQNFFGIQWLQASSPSSMYLQREELVLEEILTHYSRMALSALECGEFVQCGRWLMSLQSILTTSEDEAKVPQRPQQPIQHPTHSGRSKQHSGPVSRSLYDRSSHCLQQIASLSGQSIGKLDSIREMVDSFLSCLRLFINDYLDTPSSVSPNSHESHSPMDAPSDQEALFLQYDAICSHLVEVRAVLYSLYRDRDAYQSSEILPILDEFLRTIDRLFNQTNTTQSVLPTVQTLRQFYSNKNTASVSATLPLEMVKAFKSLFEPLGKISFGLRFVCGSLGGEILLELLQMDLDARYGYETPLRSGAKFSHNHSQAEEKLISTPPSTFSELIGEITSLLSPLLAPSHPFAQDIAKRGLLVRLLRFPLLSLPLLIFLGKPSEGRPHIYRSYRPGPLARFVLDRNTSDYGRRGEDCKEQKFFKSVVNLRLPFMILTPSVSFCV
jgi:quinol monooxygenase YgiN